MRTIKLFVYEYDKKYTDSLQYSAGEICENGDITNQKAGAEETFSIGMPVYDMDNNEIGKLSMCLFDNLNYSLDLDIKIPVETWRVIGYKGKRQNIKTFYQANN
jgi:hypothetical protein